MRNKIAMYLAGAGTAVAGFVMAASAFAQTSFSVPTSTASNLTAIIGEQLSDPGTLTVVVLAAGLPLAFWGIHQLIGLLPKSRGSRR